MPFYKLNFHKPIHFTLLDIVLHCLLKTQLSEDQQPLTPYYKVPLIIEQHQFLAPLLGSFGLFKRQFYETRLLVDHSIGNFVPFSLNSVFLLFVYFVALICFVLLCMSVWVRNSKCRLETFEVFFESLFDTPTSSPTSSIMAEERERVVPPEAPRRTMYELLHPI